MFRTTRWPHRSSFTIGAALAVLVFLAPAADAGQLLGDGVVVDSAAGVAYAMSPAGGIDAVDLTSGAIRWNSGAAAKPLHLTEGLLIAQAESGRAGSLELAALDTRGSGQLQAAITLGLENGALGSVDNHPGRAFRAEVGGRVNDLLVAWRESRAVDDRFVVRAPALDGSLAPVVATEGPQPLVTGAYQVDFTARRATPVEPDQNSVAVSRPAVDEGDYLAGIEGRQTLSADGGHVLAVRRTGAPGEWQKWEWSAYTLSGALVGRIERHTASAPFVVSGSTLVFADRPFTRVANGEPVSEPAKLRGVDLVSGLEVWSHELRDTAYTGPFQP